MQPALSPLQSFVNIVVFVIDTPFGIETPDLGDVVLPGLVVSYVPLQKYRSGTRILSPGNTSARSLSV